MKFYNYVAPFSHRRSCILARAAWQKHLRLSQVLSPPGKKWEAFFMPVAHPAETSTTAVVDIKHVVHLKKKNHACPKVAPQFKQRTVIFWSENLLLDFAFLLEQICFQMFSSKFTYANGYVNYSMFFILLIIYIWLNIPWIMKMCIWNQLDPHVWYLIDGVQW